MTRKQSQATPHKRRERPHIVEVVERKALRRYRWNDLDVMVERLIGLDADEQTWWYIHEEWRRDGQTGRVLQYGFRKRRISERQLS